jgi:hypothetical protein
MEEEEVRPMFVSTVFTAFALSGAVPTPGVIDSLHALLAREQRVRLVCESGTREVDRPLIDSTGMRSGSWEHPRRPSVFYIGAVKSEPAPTVPWSEIREIQVGGGHAGRGLVIGTLAGLTVGTLLAISFAVDAHGYADIAPAVASFTVCALAGPIIGTVIGGNRGWRSVYRDDHIVGSPRMDESPSDSTAVPAGAR